MTGDDGPADRGDSPAGDPSGDHGLSADDQPSGYLPVDGGVPDFVSARDHVQDELVRFARVLRRAGAEVPANAALTGARALVEVGFEEEPARAALRAAFLTRHEDIEAFERHFPEFWRRLTAGLEPTGPVVRLGEDGPEGGLRPPGGQLTSDDTTTDSDDIEGDTGTTVETTLRRTDEDNPEGSRAGETTTASTYSRTGASAPVEIPPAALAGEDLEGALRDLTRAVAELSGRRWARGGGSRADTRRALRESFGTGGTIVSVPRKERKLTAVRCLLLVDVSKSVLDTIDRGFLVRFLRAALARWRHARVFFFDDSVREVTTQLNASTANEALAALEHAETEWGGGTRIGHAVETVRREHPDAVDRDTVAFVISDGLEVGEIDRLERGMAWLSRRAASVLWLNPLATSPEYNPAVRGMEAALPYVAGLFAFADAGDVAEIARQLRLQGTGGVIGYEQDPRRHSGEWET